MLIFMTDGKATQGETESDVILSNVASANVMGARMFVFGLGSEIDQQLLLTWDLKMMEEQFLFSILKIYPML